MLPDCSTEKYGYIIFTHVQGTGFSWYAHYDQASAETPPHRDTQKYFKMEAATFSRMTTRIVSLNLVVINLFGIGTIKIHRSSKPQDYIKASAELDWHQNYRPHNYSGPSDYVVFKGSRWHAATSEASRGIITLMFYFLSDRDKKLGRDICGNDYLLPRTRIQAERLVEMEITLTVPVQEQ